MAIDSIVINTLKTATSLSSLRYGLNIGMMAVPVITGLGIANTIKNRMVSGFDIRGLAVGGGIHGIYSGTEMNGQRKIY